MSTHFQGEGNIGSPPEFREFPRDGEAPRRLLRLNVYFDHSIPDGKGGYADRGGFWCRVEWWHRDAERFAALFQKGLRVKVDGQMVMDRWEKDGETLQEFKIQAARVALLPHRILSLTLAQTAAPEPRSEPADLLDDEAPF